MGEITQKENAWQEKATQGAIAAASKIALNTAGLPPATPVGGLTDLQWGWIVTAALFAWIQIRCEQAIEEGLSQEQAVCQTGLTPSPNDVAVVHSILPELGEQAEQAGVDWSEPLAKWELNTMTNFLLLAWRLIDKAERARDQSTSQIVRPPQELNDSIPFHL
jgi:hypothetical protein